jgi:hypothetical protein
MLNELMIVEQMNNMKQVEQEEIEASDGSYLISKDGKIRKERCRVNGRKLVWYYYYPKIRTDYYDREYVMITQKKGEATKHYVASLILDAYDENALLKYLLARVLKKIDAESHSEKPELV